MRGIAGIALSVSWALAPVVHAQVRVGSKAFTESVILGEMVCLLAEQEGERAEHWRELGGTRVLYNALDAGQIDLYPEYTGTIQQELFPGQSLDDLGQIRGLLEKDGIAVGPPLGFNNSYALAVRRDTAQQRHLRTISDLHRYPDLKLGLSNEFLDRVDGWPGLQARYDLPQRDVRGMDHSLAYQALASGAIDVVDVYTTDPHVEIHDLVLLEDDLGHFPQYQAVFLYRLDLPNRAPRLVQALRRLAGQLDDRQMRALNRLVEVDGLSERQAAGHFLRQTLGWTGQVRPRSLMWRVRERTLEHLLLVASSLTAAILVAVPLGIVAAKQTHAGQLIVSAAEIVQTIPGLALLVFIAVVFSRVHLPMIGAWPAIVALFLYSLLPIIRSTLAGLQSIAGSIHESARAIGLSPVQRLWLVELPLASPLILAGIKTTAVINVGYAALGGLIGAGGYGQPIMSGLRLNDPRLMMEGAVPAAVLALVVKGLFSLVERWLVPRGLRGSTKPA